MGETCFLLEGGCGRADANGDNFDMVAISVSLFGDVWERALSERCEHDILPMYLFLVMRVVFQAQPCYFVSQKISGNTTVETTKVGFSLSQYYDI